MKTVDFYFDFGSANAFLAHRVIPSVEQRTGVSFRYIPTLLGGLFKLTGNQSPLTAFAGIKNKPEYELLEAKRFITRHRIDDFRMNPHFPINTLLIMRGAVAAQQLGVFAAYVDHVFDDMWARGRDMGKPETVAESLAEAGLPTEALFELSQSDRVKQQLVDNTQTAFENGAFGSPTFLVGKELFFGKDRLRDVEDEINGQKDGMDA